METKRIKIAELYLVVEYTDDAAQLLPTAVTVKTETPKPPVTRNMTSRNHRAKDAAVQTILGWSGEFTVADIAANADAGFSTVGKVVKVLRQQRDIIETRRRGRQRFYMNPDDYYKSD